MQLDCEALYQAIDQQRRQRRVRSMRAVCREAGIFAPSMTRLGHGYPPSTATLILLLGWLGSYDLTPYLTECNRE